MSAKHTPGPWKAESFAGRINVWPISRRKEDGSAICYDCSEADARLIASAPDVLEALRRLMACYESSHSPTDRMDAWTQARAAIAKAEGKQ